MNNSETKTVKVTLSKTKFSLRDKIEMTLLAAACLACGSALFAALIHVALKVLHFILTLEI